MDRKLPKLVLMLSAAVLTGCGTRRGGTGSSIAPQELAAQLATSMALTKKWTAIIYGGLPILPPAEQPHPCEYAEGPVMPGPDGSQVFTFRYENCEVETKTVSNNSTRSVVVSPSGRSYTVTVVQTMSIPRQLLVTNERWEYSNGDSVVFDRSQFIPERRTEIKQGRAILNARQIEADFELNRFARDDLTMALSDGARFTLSVPVLRPVTEPFPDFGVRTRGTYTPAGGAALGFELAGTATRAGSWNELMLTAPGGLRGRLALGADFSAEGELTDATGQATASLSLDREGDIRVTLLGQREASTAGPSAAALAFLQHLWRELAVGSSPAPLSR